jgi:DedD protein
VTIAPVAPKPPAAASLNPSVNTNAAHGAASAARVAASAPRVAAPAPTPAPAAVHPPTVKAAADVPERRSAAKDTPPATKAVAESAERRAAVKDTPPAAKVAADTSERRLATKDTPPARDTVKESKDAARDSAAAKDKELARADSIEKKYVVQVGAFADASAASDTRSRLEKLGIRSYTQVIETEAGRRIRVRVGPFASREEADKALGKLRAAGLPSALMPM